MFLFIYQVLTEFTFASFFFIFFFSYSSFILSTNRDCCASGVSEVTVRTQAATGLQEVAPVQEPKDSAEKTQQKPPLLGQ